MKRKVTRKKRPRARNSSRSLTQKAYRVLERMIVTLEIPPGSAVSEAELSKRLGIGRTPIREALQRLAREQLVLILPRRGIIVSEINVDTQLRLVEVRRVVECLIARVAARRVTKPMRERFEQIALRFEKCARAKDDAGFIDADREFNDLCIEAAHNEFATGAMTLMHSLSRRFWFRCREYSADMPAMARLHGNMARAIATGDETKALLAAGHLLDAIEKFTRAAVTPGL